MIMKWSVARGPVCLSVNKRHNLFVVSEREQKLQVFITHGILICERNLFVVAPWQFIKLQHDSDNNAYVVSYFGGVDFPGVKR